MASFKQPRSLRPSNELFYEDFFTESNQIKSLGSGEELKSQQHALLQEGFLGTGFLLAYGSGAVWSFEGPLAFWNDYDAHQNKSTLEKEKWFNTAAIRF